MSAFARRMPATLALWLTPIATMALAQTSAFAQSGGGYGQPYSDPYKSGPTRPLDGSPRNGVYASGAAPSYDTPRRDLGTQQGEFDVPPIWRGLYAGVQAGGRWSSTTADSMGFSGLKTTGVQAGGFVGINAQTGNFVYGVESDLMLGGASTGATSSGIAASMKDSWTATLRARAGFAVGQGLIYGTGGLALAGQDFSLASSASSVRITDARAGYVLGGGVEYKFSHNLSGRIEGLHYSYKDSLIGWAGSNQSVKLDSNVVRAGMTYHFN